MEEWKEYKLGEVVDILDYKRIPLSSKERSTRHGTYPYYGAQGIIDYIDDYIFDGTYLLIAEDGENLKSQKQDVAQLASGKFWVNNHAHIVDSNGKCDIRYICYLLNTLDLSGYITGSAQPKLNQANLVKISITLPSLETQKRIADCLSIFDDKIEVNRRINDNLEQQAQALFKSWFVDFDPFKDQPFVESELGMIPQGWRLGCLSNVADIIMGSSPSGSSYNVTGDGDVFYQGRAEFSFRFPRRNMYTTEAKRYADVDSVLLSVRAPVGDINVAEERCCIGRGLASVKSNEGNSSYILYLMQSLKPVFDQFNGEGTVFGSINKKALEELKILIAPKEIRDSFEDIANKIDSEIKVLDQESRRLAELRDTLLPHLMSGELRVTDVDLVNKLTENNIF